MATPGQTKPVGSYLVVFIVAAVIAGVITPLMAVVAHRLGALDDTRDPPVPRAGGLVIAGAAVLALVLVSLVLLPTALTLLGTAESINAVALGGVGILVLGVIDDAYPLPARIKFSIQIAIALAVYLAGVRVDLLSLPIGTVDLGVGFGVVATVIWLVGITNAFNLLDGADGVAAGSAFFAAAAVFLVSVTLGHPAIGLVAAAMAGGLLGFLPYNFPPARAFLGDSGSLFAGFMLAGLAVEGSTKGPTVLAIAVPILAFGVPIFDTGLAIFRRLVTRRSVFARDHDHVHHVLGRAGLSPRQVAGVIYGASALFALVAMVFINPSVRSVAVAFVVLGAGVWMAARFLRLHELNELARMARRGARGPRAIGYNVELRRGTERLATAQTLDDLKAGVVMLMERSEFDDVLLSVSVGADRRGNTTRWRMRDGDFVEDWPPRRPDEWEVVCPFEGDGWRGELVLRRRLGRPELLVDLNLMIELVQGALTEAAERIAPPVAVA